MNNNMYGAPTPMGQPQNAGYGQPMGGNMAPKSNKNTLVIVGVVAAVVVVAVIVFLLFNNGGKKFSCTTSQDNGESGSATVKETYEFNKKGDKIRTVTTTAEFKGGSATTDAEIQQKYEAAQEECEEFKDAKAVTCKVSKSGKKVTEKIVVNVDKMTEEEADDLGFDLDEYKSLTYDSAKAQAQASAIFTGATCK